MADLSAVARVRVIDARAEDQFSAPADEAITVGKVVRWNDSSGEITTANGTAAGEADAIGINISGKTNAANMPADVLCDGLVLLLDSSDANILAGLDYGVPVYLSDTDGRLADAAGTVSRVMGYVYALWDQSTPTKVLRLVPQY